MSRLFWKIFFGFWLTLVITGAGVGVVVHLYNQARWAEMNEVAAGPRAEFAVVAAAVALEQGGARAVESLFDQWPGRRRPPVLVVDESGRDLFSRTVPEASLKRARERLAESPRPLGVREVAAPDGRAYLLFVPVPEGMAPPHRHSRHHDASFQNTLVLRLGMALAASLLFSAGLAWYLTRPVRHLRRASRRLADGELDTRVMPLMGRRRDEIADLGRDFDHMAARLQALVGAQKRLLHDVSHELRSPLARLRVAVGLARQQPDKAAATLDRIEHETERLDELVGQVLTLSRLEAPVNDAPEDYLDLGGLLQAVVDDVRFEAEAGGRQVTLRAPGEIVVKAHGELLRRALENVLRNAVKYTAPGTAVEVSMQAAEGGEWVTVSVCDHGPGVPESDLGALFEPFYRGAAPGTAGYGLGLTIAKRAVEAHGGEISIRNRPGGGLCAAIRLPLAPEED